MKHLKIKILALCALLVLVAATLLAPVGANAEGCPNWWVDCPGGMRQCSGAQGSEGTCIYSSDCLSCDNVRNPILD